MELDINNGSSLDLDINPSKNLDIEPESPKVLELNLEPKDLYIDIDAELSKVLDIELGSTTTIPTGTFVHINTTAYWNSLEHFVGQRGHIYVYSDHSTIDGQFVPAIKIGDGQAYLIDNPFVSSNQELLLEHINDHSIHITPQERTLWNNKVRCDDTTVVGENIMFTKN